MAEWDRCGSGIKQKLDTTGEALSMVKAASLL